MRLTLNQLKSIIKEEVAKASQRPRSGTSKRRLGEGPFDDDIREEMDQDYGLVVEFSIDVFMDSRNNNPRLKDGQDVTSLLSKKSQEWHGMPLPPATVATVVDAHGASMGNPLVSLSFTDEDAAWEWYSVFFETDDIADMHANEA
jgi:hypothetical protein